MQPAPVIPPTRAHASPAGGSTAAPAASSATAAPVQTDVSARLASLADLHGRGELSDEEYTAAKARALAGD